jgi:TPR repeat protein
MSIHAEMTVASEMPQSFFELGLAHSIGSAGSVNLIEAHKWFNIAAAQGDRMAARHREELAEEMTKEEIAAALRAAREFLRRH